MEESKEDFFDQVEYEDFDEDPEVLKKLKDACKALSDLEYAEEKFSKCMQALEESGIKKYLTDADKYNEKRDKIEEIIVSTYDHKTREDIRVFEQFKGRDPTKIPSSEITERQRAILADESAPKLKKKYNARIGRMFERIGKELFGADANITAARNPRPPKETSTVGQASLTASASVQPAPSIQPADDASEDDFACLCQTVSEEPVSQNQSTNTDDDQHFPDHQNYSVYDGEDNLGSMDERPEMDVATEELNVQETCGVCTLKRTMCVYKCNCKKSQVCYTCLKSWYYMCINGKKVPECPICKEPIDDTFITTTDHYQIRKDRVAAKDAERAEKEAEAKNQDTSSDEFDDSDEEDDINDGDYTDSEGKGSAGATRKRSQPSSSRELPSPSKKALPLHQEPLPSEEPLQSDESSQDGDLKWLRHAKYRVSRITWDNLYDHSFYNRYAEVRSNIAKSMLEWFFTVCRKPLKIGFLMVEDIYEIQLFRRAIRKVNREIISDYEDSCYYDADVAGEIPDDVDFIYVRESDGKHSPTWRINWDRLFESKKPFICFSSELTTHPDVGMHVSQNYSYTVVRQKNSSYDDAWICGNLEEEEPIEPTRQIVIID